MGGSFKLGRISNIDVKVHWTFFLLLAFFAFVGASGGLLGSLVAVVIILALFFCVLLHEFGHSLVAQRLGIEVPDITLLPLGGVARLKSLPEKPFDEVKIAIAGPIVNVVLAPIFFVAATLLGANVFDLRADAAVIGGQASVGQVLSYIGLMNIALAVFNLIPAFPMDGGRILRGLLAARLGPVRATNIASTVGQIFAAIFFFIGLANGQFLLALVAVFIFFGAQGEQQFVRQRETMRGIAVSDVMGTKKRTETVSPYNNFGQVMDAVIHGYQEDFPVVDDESGRLVGLLTRNEILAAAHSPSRYGTVRDLMKTDFPTISPSADLFADGYRLLQENGLRAMPVVENGELVGMLTVDDIGQASLLRDLRRQQF